MPEKSNSGPFKQLAEWWQKQEIPWTNGNRALSYGLNILLFLGVGYAAGQIDLGSLMDEYIDKLDDLMHAHAAETTELPPTTTPTPTVPPGTPYTSTMTTAIEATQTATMEPQATLVKEYDHGREKVASDDFICITKDDTELPFALARKPGSTSTYTSPVVPKSCVTFDEETGTWKIMDTSSLSDMVGDIDIAAYAGQKGDNLTFTDSTGQKISLAKWQRIDPYGDEKPDFMDEEAWQHLKAVIIGISNNDTFFAMKNQRTGPIVYDPNDSRHSIESPTPTPTP